MHFPLTAATLQHRLIKKGLAYRAVMVAILHLAQIPEHSLLGNIVLPRFALVRLITLA